MAILPKFRALRPDRDRDFSITAPALRPTTRGKTNALSPPSVDTVDGAMCVGLQWLDGPEVLATNPAYFKSETRGILPPTYCEVTREPYPSLKICRARRPACLPVLGYGA
jgi:hypothetical protein